jgi:hypothetical protein
MTIRPTKITGVIKHLVGNATSVKQISCGPLTRTLIGTGEEK